MILLILGLALFLGAHSVRIFADSARSAFIARRGDRAWKGLYALASAIGLILIIVGYARARGGDALYVPPPSLKHLTFVLVWLGFVLTAASNGPANHIRSLLRDPMVIGVGLWALGHLLVKATPAAVALFGAFLVWAVLDLISVRRRASAAPPADAAPPKALATAISVILGTVLWAVFALFLHRWLIGVAPLG